MITGVIELFNDGLKDAAIMVLLMSIIIPFINLLSLLYVLLSLSFNKNMPGSRLVFRTYNTLHCWGMLDVYMLGIIVAIVKLADFASVSTGFGLYALIALIVISLSASATLDHQLVWKRLELMNDQ